MRNKKKPVIYPKWAPAELCEYHEQWVTDHPDLKNEALSTLEKLVTDKRMQPIWEKLKSTGKKCDDYAFSLFMLVQNTEGPYGAEKLPKAKLRNAVQGIEKESRKLTRLLSKVMPFAFIENAPKSPDYLIINVVNNLERQARQILNEPRTLSRPGSNFVKRTYFARQLSAFFTEEFGSPMHGTIAELYLIFASEDGNDIISAGDVASILRDSPL